MYFVARAETYICNCGHIKMHDDFLYPVTCCYCGRKYLKVDGKIRHVDELEIALINDNWFTRLIRWI